MAIIKITELPAASSPVSPSDVTPVVQNGVTKKAAVNQLGFTPNGVGAVTRTIQEKLRDVISVKDFGAVGDGIADDTAAIQAAINAAIYNNNLNTADGLKLRVYIPGGIYRITDTIHIGYGTLSSQYTSCVVEGDGYAYRAEIFAGTAIIADFNDRPAFNFQGARGSVLRGLAIKGKNFNWIQSNNLGYETGNLLDDLIPSNWVNPAFPASASSRYAPYAAISIDAYAGNKPAVSYPNVNYPAFLGSVAQYNKTFSSDVLIEDVYINGFVVGVVNQPCDADANADYTALRRVSIDSCQYGVSVCNTQSRAFHMDSVKVIFVYTALTTNKHGRQNGRLNGTIFDFNVGQSINLIELNSSAFYGPVTFLHWYCEACWRIGSITSSTSVETSLIFQSCIFEFTLQTDARGVPNKMLDGAASVPMDCRFIGCNFGNFKSVLTLWQLGCKLEGSQIVAKGREVNLNLATQQYIAFASNALAGGLVTPNLNTYDNHRIKFVAFNLDTAEVNQTSISQDEYRVSTRTTGVPAYCWVTSARNEIYSDNVQTPRYLGVSAKNTLTVSLTNKTLSVTFPGRADWEFNMYGPDNGDVIVCSVTGMTFFVRSRTGNTITAEAQNNYKSNGSGGFTPLVAFSTTSGNFYWVTGRFYTPQFFLIGDIASGNNVITNCQRGDGFAAWYNSQIAVNDRVYIFDTQDQWVSPTASLITARDQTAQTITLAGNATYTQVRKRLATFIRQPPANV